MTITTHRTSASRQTVSCVDADLRQLAEQLQRCARDRGPAARMRSLADGLRSFTSRHVTSVTAVVVLAAAALSQLS